MVLHIAVCEIYHPQIHGATEQPPSDIANRFIVREILSANDFFSSELTEIISVANEFYHDRGPYLKAHPTIDNYHAIIRSPRYSHIDIVEVENCSGEDGIEWCTGALKTSYIRILQKTWRNTRKRRDAYIQACKSLYALQYRETMGKLPSLSRRIALSINSKTFTATSTTTSTATSTATSTTG
jgi:hypothetical protein